MLSVTDAKYLKDFEVEVTFSDGRIGRVDLSELVHKDSRSVFAPLRDKEFFKNFTVDYTIRWGEGVDLAPEFLYFKAFEKQKELHERFKKWGYVAYFRSRSTLSDRLRPEMGDRLRRNTHPDCFDRFIFFLMIIYNP